MVNLLIYLFKSYTENFLLPFTPILRGDYRGMRAKTPDTPATLDTVIPPTRIGGTGDSSLYGGTSDHIRNGSIV